MGVLERLIPCVETQECLDHLSLLGEREFTGVFMPRLLSCCCFVAEQASVSDKCLVYILGTVLSSFRSFNLYLISAVGLSEDLG